ncbi:hypothetical protein K0T92_08325 [Paenibacillus oenotherae]|uniref:Glycoside-hydrolase family GH114 TIM-barrel domain-containing protein n=1 Tax=Paenibacillus oenotherae TaxID=1435645 RepID=A0ABS7D4E3_9BACL|nr:hypothetical protein [Paenibacillus oenotherae]MBW7474750.1 hypothetical protein [Paenibacillus oenotherae]
MRLHTRILPKIRIFLLLIICSLIVTSTASLALQGTPPGYRLLIYYGTPAGVNKLWEPKKAAAVFSGYDYVVFGDKLQFPEAVHHTSTLQVIKFTKELNPDIKLFGYVDLGVTTDNLSMDEIKKRVNLWRDMGATGIFLDDAGFDYKVSRSRLNTALGYIHSLDMPAFINAWHPEQVMSNAPHSVYNPTGEKTLIGSNDYYLLEDFLQPTDITIPNQESAFTSAFRTKIDKVIAYRKTLGVKLLSVSVIDYSTYSAQAVRKFFRMNETTAAVFSLDGFGLAPAEYSSSKISSDEVRTFPYILNYMDYYTKDVTYVAKYNNQDFSSRGFRIHSVTNEHFYNYPADVVYE